MPILNTILMLGVIFFSIGFLHKLGSQKEYVLRVSLLILGIVTLVLLGSKLASIFAIKPLSHQIVDFCRIILPYSQAFVIFVLGSKFLKDTKIINIQRKKCLDMGYNREPSHHGVDW